jgi:tetratricopeptide (TPR) repeat protein
MQKNEIYHGFLFSVYFTLGNVYLHHDKPAMAVKYFKLSNRTRKNDLATLNLGIIHFDYYSNYKKAFYYFKSLKMCPEHPMTLEYAIRCLKIMGKDLKAEAFFERLKKILPSRYEEMREFYSDPNWRNYQYPLRVAERRRLSKKILSCIESVIICMCQEFVKQDPEKYSRSFVKDLCKLPK